MGRTREQAVIAATALAVAAVAVVLFDGGPAEFAFLTALLVPLLLGLRVALAGAVEAHRESDSARRLVRADPARVARDAVAAERARLSLDVQSAVRGNVELMRALAHEAADRWEGDPRPALQAIQEQGRHAMTDLRRLLGLLRDPQPWPGEGGDAPPRRLDRVPLRRRFRRMDVVLAAVAVGVALAESSAYRLLEDAGTTPLGVLLTGVVAATIVGRTVAPGAAALLAGALIAVGTVVMHPVGSGFWIVVTLGSLAWACGAREPRPLLALVGLMALVAALVHKHQAYEPDNLLITLIILGAGLASGVLVRVARSRAERARSTARARRVELGSVTQQALLAERRTVARDLHDIVSGSIGVIVMQAGAAQALLGTDPHRARHALDVVLETCESALAELAELLVELDSSGLGGGTAQRSMRDVLELVGRMRSAGLDLRLTLAVDDEVGGSTSAVAYRVIQESLTNVLRHAPGSHGQVELRDEGDWLLVDVSDDGPGSAGPTVRGYGLVGLAERVQQVGGVLRVQAGPVDGFRVTAQIPARRAPLAAPEANHIAVPSPPSDRGEDAP